jgi:hypothetical protein
MDMNTRLVYSLYRLAISVHPRPPPPQEVILQSYQLAAVQRLRRRHNQ